MIACSLISDMMFSTCNTLLFHHWLQHNDMFQSVPACVTCSTSYPTELHSLILTQNAVISIWLKSMKFNLRLDCVCKQYLKENVIIMELRLWPEIWEIIIFNCLVYYVQFICKQCSALCVMHPSSIAFWHLPLHAGGSFWSMCPSHT